MKEKKTDGKGRRGRRFREAVDGPIVRRLYATMPTAELARLMGLTVRQIKNYVYRNNLEDWASKDAATLSCGNSKLTSLDVSKNTALTYLSCYKNQIKGKSMYKLVKSLPKASETRLRVLYIIGEKYKMNRKQAAAAKAKGWIPQYYYGREWREYTGKKLRLLKVNK
ncbi:MAG: hypothetical protein J6W52_12340 [Bacteroidaceae bacterium]|nr:hypothetical protein [Bacteroidaceae bacterium]